MRRSAVVLLCLLVAGVSRASADKVVDLSRALTTDPDFKVRLTAAVVLAKLRDRRAAPALIQGLDDTNETVRGMSAAALGSVGDLSAIGPLERLASDRSEFVRARAHEAIQLLRPRDVVPPPSLPTPRPRPGVVTLALGATHDKTRHGGPWLTQRLHETLVQQIGELPNFALGGPEDSGYVIDSSIDEMSRKVTDRYVEITCEVTLIVNRRGRGMAGRASGGATVQVPKAGYQVAKEQSIQVEALENAVRGAHPSLIELIAGLQASR